MENPFAHLPDPCFWRRSVGTVEAHLFDPVTAPRFRLPPSSRIATAGSCFAQHISRALVAAGCNYMVCEDGSHLAPGEREKNGYGVFSARYGNIYTTLQLNQLFDEAFGLRTPHDCAWRRKDGRWIDPYRQQVEPAGFDDPDAVAADRHAHLAAVRRMFEQCDVLVFTLGLTECWISQQDGSAYSSAPGVVGDAFDPERHAFANLDVVRCHAELRQFLISLREINPSAQVLLTVSPVPLAATAEPRSVVVSTGYSKSVLRVVAEMAVQEFEFVDYFPSYEIITGSQSFGRYFEDDGRHINRLGVSHAMRCFFHNYVEWAPSTAAPIRPPVSATEGATQIMCDEDALDSREAM